MIITVISLFAVYAELSGLYEIQERQTIDLRTRLIRKNIPLPSQVAIILIDEASLNYVNYFAGRWPWPRDIHADLIQTLKQWGAKDIIIDLLFTENQFAKATTGNGLSPDDAALAGATASAGIVYHSVQLVEDVEDPVNKTRLNRNMPDDFLNSFAISVISGTGYSGYTNFYLPFHELYLASKGIGVITFEPDKDNVSREERLVFNYKGNYFPGLALSPILNRYGKNIAIPMTNNALSLPDVTIPLRRQKYYVNMYGRFEKNVYSYGGVLVTIGKLHDGILENLPVKPEEFDGKTVFVGTSAVGLEADLKNTAIGTKTPGVFLHASIFGNIITGDFLKFVPRSLSFAAVVMLVIVTVVSIFYIRNLFAQVIIPLSSISLYLFVSYILFKNNSVTMIINPLFSCVGAYILSFTYIGTTEGRDKRKIKNILGQYVSPAMLNEVLERHKEDYFKAGVGTREELTMFFSDIRDFTSISEQLREEQVVEMLNAYLSRMVNIIFDNEGTLDKFIGDAVVAFWGAPLRHDDDHYRAVKSALEMIDSLSGINRYNKRNNLPELAIGIGIHTGSVILGNIGSEKKLDYTIIGDNVNLTSRLEGLTKAYRCDIIISGETYNHVKDRILCRMLDYVVVKGKNKPIMIYSVLNHMAAAGQEDTNIVALSRQAFEFYRNRQFCEAVVCYENILEIRPDDYPAAMMIERSTAYMTVPPPQDWDGSFVLTAK